MSKERIKGIVMGFILSTVLSASFIVLANTNGVMREVFYGVRVVVDGVPQNFDYDMRPFLTGGRAFLPVRGIADALGLDVDWDGSTQTVYIGGRPTPFVGTYLDQMGHTNYRTSGPDNHFLAWSSGRATTAGDTFNRGFLFRLGNWAGDGNRDTSNLTGAVRRESDDTPWLSYQTMDFILNGQYLTFNGTIVCAASDRAVDNVQGAQVRVYGDGRLLYTSPPISEGTRTVDFNINVSGVLMLQIHVSIPNVQTIPLSANRITTSRASSGATSTYVGIVNARFERR